MAEKDNEWAEVSKEEFASLVEEVSGGEGRDDGTTELKLNSPITKEQWEILTDANLEHSDTMWFDTPNGNHFEYKKVRNGKWTLNKEGNWACPFCEFDPYHDNMKGMNYCPNCGARMENEPCLIRKN